jgi:queuine tRNA-ribosyltransferase
LIKSLGGLHAFAGFPGTILTDSGGFQLFSLIRENPQYGEIRDAEIIFRPDRGKDKLIFTPEKCIGAQFQFGSDVMMALDVCTHPDDPPAVQQRGVALTVNWARRCRDAYDARVKPGDEKRPLLFGIVQGGSDPDLRSACGEALEQIGFDGYGFGGWPLDTAGNLRYDILKAAADAMPDGKVKYAMGLGKPEEIVRLAALGYSLFDCVIPTREARHHRLYAFRDGCASADAVRGGDARFYQYLYILDDDYCRDARPADRDCDCPLCARYSRAYLHHLFKVNDPQAFRLATAHNLRFYARLMAFLRDE